MKNKLKISLSLFILCLAQTVMAATYYVSNSGSDSNAGTSPSLSWKTLNKVSAAALQPGDQVLFNCGDVFYGSMTITQSGTAGNPITFGSYGSGANPVISGFTAINGWNNLGSNIWESTGAVSALATCNMVTVNEVNIAMGRYPSAGAANGGYLNITSNPGTTSLTSTGLTGTPNWSGAEVVIRINRYQINYATITSQTGGTLNFSPAISAAPSNGYGFFIENSPLCLTNQNDWYYNSSTGKLDMYSASQPSNVNIASVDYLFTVNSSYITIQNLTFTGTNTAAIYNSEPGDIYTGLIVQNCSILYSGGYGIKLKMLNLTVNNNIISNTNNSGILIPQQGNTDIITITGNTVTNSGVFQGMGNTGSAFDGISVSNKQNGFIENNTVINSGYCGISVGGASNLIKNNFVNTFCTILDDGGGIYTYNTQNHIITGNIVLNGVGAYYGTPGTTTIANGIYLDFGTVYSTVSYNTCANNANYGIFTDAGNTTLIYNTCFNNLTQYLENDHNGNSVNNAIYNNIFISKSSTQLAVEYDYLSANPQDIGTQNSNYYSRPVTGDGAIIREWPESGSAVNMTLSQWQAFSSQDANSKGSPETIPSASDFQFAYNNTTSNSVVTLAQPMTNITGKAYAGSVTLSPFTSIVLLADVVAPSVPTGLAAVAALLYRST